MKRVSSLTLVTIAALALSACSTPKLFSSNNEGVNAPKVEAVLEKTASLSTEFKREGVKIYYTWSGDVDRIEAKGFANVWTGEFEHVAELQAKEKIVKFLRGETVTSSRKTQVIAKSLERAQDNTLNKFKSVDGSVNTTAEEIEKEAGDKEENSRTNTALRKASINNAQIVTSTLTVSSAGRLTAVRKISGEVVNDGKVYVATYMWSPRDQKAARSIANMMDAR